MGLSGCNGGRNLNRRLSRISGGTQTQQLVTVGGKAEHDLVHTDPEREGSKEIEAEIGAMRLQASGCREWAEAPGTWEQAGHTFSHNAYLHVSAGLGCGVPCLVQRHFWVCLCGRFWRRLALGLRRAATVLHVGASLDP